ncbi:formate--tetrahydrofolate ligase [Phreatobacter aquaticus]|uniref:Formate--tetrahydrofolate ligase n=1 Tax=Phreatobacter aquaticus TaxID=2570229 RepID=A0A4D7QLE4_9HYPH|nr:formate--tetrahydrofolate ligase [Phreatobacter aquaticus]QCK85987.1 formate--tetrahydrofolate ligase [Phreatobacter aquaticus]
MSHDLAVARAATLQPIAAIADKIGIPSSALDPYGKHIAKLDEEFLAGLKDRPDGRLVLVTAINPTPAGEGKTTTTIGLGDGLNRIGKRAVIALREPSLGPVFGTKGGATGGGKAQVLPMEAINLHFTGDFHAITSAHNLLSALIDNHIHWGNSLGFDTRRIVWRRVLDMNDRALRQLVVGLGGAPNGFSREDGFDITVASEVMACFCLADGLADLEARLARIVVGYTRAKKPITAGELNAAGAMTVLLKDAIRPNLVQTIEGSPALIHGGPFANIAHGCNSVIATRAALKLGDYVVTEAGFGADLGAEKFFDIKCRKAGLKPEAVVLVATVRALKMNGGVAKADLARENLDALSKGIVNLGRHVKNLRSFGVPVIVAINHFTTDSEAEHALIARICADDYGVEAVQCRHWADGAAGAEELARKVVALCEGGTAAFKPIYPDVMPLADKIRTIATSIYGAADVAISSKAAADLQAFEAAGYGNLPICMAKTQYSFSADPTLLGAPSGHVVPVREVRLSAGAGFVVAICGDIMTMPGLPRLPAAEAIHINAEGQIEGLF